jgi:NAD(P)-dependent dehydrogenase (short-subunit alcohol dehydrogenase family)
VTELQLSSLRPGYRALLFGAGGGIGAAVTKALAADPGCRAVFAAARSRTADAGKVRGLRFDLTDEASIADAVAAASTEGPLDLVFVATGLLHDGVISPEKSLRALDATAMTRAFQINTIGPAMIARHALPKLGKDAKSVFAALSARVGSISDNRLGGWHSYRASKAALNMLVKTCAIEMARTNPRAVCVTLHPGTVATRLSEPFQGNVAQGKLFTPQKSAVEMLRVLDTLDATQTGGLFAWDGQQIPF